MTDLETRLLQALEDLLVEAVLHHIDQHAPGTCEKLVRAVGAATKAIRKATA